MMHRQGLICSGARIEIAEQNTHLPGKVGPWEAFLVRFLRITEPCLTCSTSFVPKFIVFLASFYNRS